MLKYSGFLLFSALFIACTADPGNNLEAYYYPAEKLHVPVEYTYIPVRDTFFEDVIWRYAVTDSAGSTLLRGENLDRLGRPTQINVEEITASGAALRSLELIDYDSTGNEARIRARIIGNDVFPFQAKDSTLVYFYKVQWDQPEDSLVVTLTRNRRYLGPATFTLGGKQLDCVRFQLRELLTTDREGMTKSQWSGEEIYARGIGLVYYRKEISPQYILEYALEDIPFGSN